MDTRLPEPRTTAGWSRAALVVALYAAMAVLAVAIGVARGRPNIYVVEGGHPGWHAAIGPLVGLVVGLIVVWLSRQSVLRFAWARRLHQEFRHLLGGLTQREIWALALGSSIGEELLFRGALLPMVGLVWSSLIFASLHVGPGRQFWPWTLSAVVIGCALGGLAVVFGDLGAPIVAHFTINFFNLGHIARDRS